jgi:cyclophilin family peptidyl-prolyl cis-trans isomerase
VINALRSLATFGDSTTAGDVIPLLDAGIANVDVQAAEALGRIGGSRARDALGRAVRQGRSWAVRRAALLALARVDGAGFREAAPTWSRSSDWRNRAAAAEGWAIASPGAPPADLLNDRDGRVVAAALSAWAGAVHGAPADLLAAGRAHLADQDPAARGAAADIVGRAPSALDAGPLVAAWHRSARDSFPDAGESALGALHHLATLPEGATARAFAGTEPSPADYQLRAWAEQNWPELADHWGPSTPIRTGRTLEDYRALARRFIVAPDSLRNPLVTVDVEGRGTLTLKLFGADAPLTVANFLRLVDARYFDGDRFHRVVPNFVVQDGDPRGDGNGGPGYAIRDEINTHRYGSGTVGMALSGPDTGGSQWFITLSPQPHLDGNYTVFGEVTSGTATLARIVQGDLIRSVHR